MSVNPNLAHRPAILSGRVLPTMSFMEKAWAVTARIPAGSVATYSQIARVLGGRASRAVGMAMSRNPYAPRVPCHRVVGADGRLTGYAGGLEKKRKLLRGEGVKLLDENRVDLSAHLFSFTQVVRV